MKKKKKSTVITLELSANTKISDVTKSLSKRHFQTVHMYDY